MISGNRQTYFNLAGLGKPLDDDIISLVSLGYDGPLFPSHKVGFYFFSVSPLDIWQCVEVSWQTPV